uniref:Uncharacterized protein n=1 Tax=Thermosporothrix sp. COM3 TaxID=2490863 RepID=A0A455SFI7_9CHLR|nr:hypothetical protein KTC_19840 [Thermosporothrix sp. COM3]
MRRQKKQRQNITPLFPEANNSTSLPTTDLVWPVYEQVRKSDGAFNVPHLHLSFNDVRVVDHIIASYSTYLQKTSHLKPSHRAKIQRLGQLRARLHGLLAYEQKGALSSAALLLTLEDLELLNEVLGAFLTLIKRLTVRSQERDELVQALRFLQRTIEDMIQIQLNGVE